MFLHQHPFVGPGTAFSVTHYHQLFIISDYVLTTTPTPEVLLFTTAVVQLSISLHKIKNKMLVCWQYGT